MTLYLAYPSQRKKVFRIWDLEASDNLKTKTEVKGIATSLDGKINTAMRFPADPKQRKKVLRIRDLEGGDNWEIWTEIKGLATSIGYKINSVMRFLGVISQKKAQNLGPQSWWQLASIDLLKQLKTCKYIEQIFLWKLTQQNLKTKIGRLLGGLLKNGQLKKNIEYLKTNIKKIFFTDKTRDIFVRSSYKLGIWTS